MRLILIKCLATFLTICAYLISLSLILDITGARSTGALLESSVPCLILSVALVLTIYAIWRRRNLANNNM